MLLLRLSCGTPPPWLSGQVLTHTTHVVLQAYHYLSSIAVKEGKVFALFVRSPSKVSRLLV